jgi:hypothetical protein
MTSVIEKLNIKPVEIVETRSLNLTSFEFDIVYYFKSNIIGYLVLKYKILEFLKYEETLYESCNTQRLRCAMVLALDEGFHKVIVQSDCLALIQKVIVPTRDRYVISPFMVDIKSLATEFVFINFYICKS